MRRLCKTVGTTLAAAVLLLVYTVAYAVSPTGVMSQDGNPVTGNCLESTGFGFAGDAGFVCANPNYLRFKQPTNYYYAAVAGNDANYPCQTVGLPCTLPGAISAALQSDFGNGDVTVWLSAGTYTAAGARIAGPLPGTANNTLNSSALVLWGTSGSAVTTIKPGCATGYDSSVAVSGYAHVKLGNLTLEASCSNGKAITGDSNALIEQVNGDLVLRSSNANIWGLVYLVQGATYRCSGNFATQIKGVGGTYAFIGSAHAKFFLCSGATHVVSDTPTFGVFIDMIDSSLFVPGIGSTWSGAVNGTKYFLEINSEIDNEDIPLQSTPGSNHGHVGHNSTTYVNQGGTAYGGCLGGSVGCDVVTGPTGLGTGSISDFDFGDTGGGFFLTGSATASQQGAVYIGLPSILQGTTNNGGHCVASPGQHFSATTMPLGTNAWAHYYTSTDLLQIDWNIPGGAIGTYYFHYVCQ